MEINNISIEMYGKPYDDLTPKEQYEVDGVCVEIDAANYRKGHGIGCYCWACCL